MLCGVAWRRWTDRRNTERLERRVQLMQLRSAVQVRAESSSALAAVRLDSTACSQRAASAQAPLAPVATGQGVRFGSALSPLCTLPAARQLQFVRSLRSASPHCPQRCVPLGLPLARGEHRGVVARSPLVPVMLQVAEQQLASYRRELQEERRRLKQAASEEQELRRQQ